MIHEARLAWRALAARPAYSLAVLATLGIGIAAVSTIYAVAHWAMLRPVPGVAAPGELVTIQLESTEDAVSRFATSHADLLTLSELASATGGLAAYTAHDVHVATGSAGDAERVAAEVVTANYFEMLGVRMAEGRGFRADENESGAAVVVVSHALWQRHWGAEGASGDDIFINGQRFTVAGIAPREFHGAELPGRAQLWMPAGALPEVLREPGILTSAGDGTWRVMLARVPGSEAARGLESTLNAGIERIREEGGAHSFGAIHMVFRVHPGIGLPPLARPAMRDALTLLASATGLLLLLACANVANLGLARAVALRPAMAVRSALGAGVGRLVRERLVESTVLGSGGAVLAIGLSVAVIGALRGAGLAGVELGDGMRALDPRVLAVTMAVAMLAALAAGVLPAIAASRGDGSSLLRAGRHGDRGSPRVRGALVITQVALSALLIVGAGLLVRSLLNLRDVDLGIRVENVLVFSLEPGLQGYDEPRTAGLIAGLLSELESDARVEAAGIAHFPPFANLSIPGVFAAPGSTDQDPPAVVRTFRVSPGFFDALGMTVDGAGLSDQHWLVRDSEMPPEAILNVAAARELFPGQSPREIVGRTITPYRGSRPPVRVAGVVADARLGNVRAGGEPYLFQPWSQGGQGGTFTVYVQTRVPPLALAPRVREIVRRYDAALPVFGLRTLRSEIDGLIADQRLVASLAAALGAVAILLAGVGLHALLAHTVLERRREIGIRSALGALPRRILLSVVGGALRLTVAGLVIGLLGAAWLTGFIESRLFGVSALDAGTYLAGAAVSLAIAAVASAVPAMRASRVDAVEVLRDP